MLVTGATGILGPKVVQHLLHCQHHVRTYARQSPLSLPQGVEVYPGDIRVGSGLIEATRGVDAIIHCATFADDGGVTDIQGSRHLVEAALANGSPHMIYISIIKIEQSPFPYFKAKLEVEHMIEQSGLPWTIVRATSFHEFVLRLLTSAENKEASTITLPAGARFQSIDANEVAHMLAHLPEQQPAGHLPDMGGPEILTLEEMAEIYKRIYNKQSVIRQNHCKDLFLTLFVLMRTSFLIMPLVASSGKHFFNNVHNRL